MKSLPLFLLPLTLNFVPLNSMAQNDVLDDDDPEAVVADTAINIWEYDEQEFSTKLKAAKKGDVEAMSVVAFMYERGFGTKRDAKKTIKWYTKAAKKGHLASMRELGGLYLFATDGDEEGKPAPYHNEKKGIEWFCKAAEAGDVSCYETLALYYMGNVDPAQPAEAIKWYRKAADAGLEHSMMTLGRSYLLGEDVEKDVEEALMWYQKAADTGLDEALSMLMRCYLTDQYGVKDCDKGVECLTKAVEAGSIYGMISLGRVYSKDEYVTPNVPEARRLFAKAEQTIIAKGVEENSQFVIDLGKCYLAGVGNMKADKTKGNNLLGLLEGTESADALSIIGDLYYEGKDIDRNYLEAMRWYKKAAAGNDLYSMYKIGVMYLHGDGVLTNAREAVKWLEKSEWYGYYDLGMCYYNGTGVEKDREHAIELLQRACMAGSEEAVQFLESIGVEPEELW